MAIDKTRISIEEFEAFLAAHPNGLYELIQGEIIEKVPTQEHGVIATKISARLLVFMEQYLRQLCREVVTRSSSDSAKACQTLPNARN